MGVIVVAAAGNSGTPGLHFPACMANTIAVGSSNWLDQRSDFSSFAPLGEIPDNGIDDDGNGWVDDTLDLIAPGELIWSTVVLSAYDALLYNFLGMVGWEPGDDTYGQADGTSFSTPLVSGYVGLILSQNPGATLRQVREVLRANAVDVLDPNGVGDSLVGYDGYSGFGRMRMVIPTLATGSNESPIADAGPDQTVHDQGKPGVELVTLDGSESTDPDGTIVSFQWLEGGEQIATGMETTVNLAVGSHTLTLRVTDDRGASAEDEVVIQVLDKRGGLPDEGGASGPPTAMGVYAIDWAAKNNLDLTVEIRCDSDENEELSGGDDPVSGASVALVLTHDSDGDSGFDCSTDNCWTFEGNTDDSGRFRAKLPRAAAGAYQAEVIALTHETHIWQTTLDKENPETFNKN
jgi:hypothetical protein